MERKKADLLAAALEGQSLRPEMLEEAGLAPLLDTARQVREARHPALPPTVLAAGLVRVREELAARRAVRRPGWFGRPAWAAAGLALMLVAVLALATTGTVLAAEGSLPGEALYPVKRSAEAVQLALTWAPEARSTLLVSLAERRLAEVQAVCSTECPSWLLADLEGQSEAAQETIEQLPSGQREKLLEKMLLLTERQQDVLARVLERAPDSARPGLERALERSRQGYERARQALEKQKEKGPEKGKEREKENVPSTPGHPLKPTQGPHKPAQGTPGKGAKQP